MNCNNVIVERFGEDRKMCHNDPLIIDEQILDEPSTQGMMKILYHFYQCIGLILLQNPKTFDMLIPVEFLVSIFSFKLQMPSLQWNACPLQTRNIFQIEIVKISVWLIPTLLISIFFLSLVIFKSMKNRNQNAKERIYQTIDQHTDKFIKRPWSVRLNCLYIQLLNYGHTSLTTSHNFH